MIKSETHNVMLWMMLFTGANIGVKGTYALAIFWLASFLSPEEYAKFGILYALQGAVATFAIFGLGETTASRLKLHPSGQRRQVLFRRMSSLFPFTTLIGIVLLIPFIVMALSGGTPLLTLISAILLGAVIAYSLLQAGFHRIEEKHAASLLSSVGIPLGALAGLVIGGWWARDVSSIFVFGFAGAFFVLITLLIKNQVLLGSLPRLKLVQKELLVLWPFLIIGIFGWLSGYGMNFVIDLKFEPIQVATFTFLLTISSINQMIASSLNMVWSPRFYQLYNENSFVLAESKSRFFFTILAITLGIFGGLIVTLLPWLTTLIGGNLVHYSEYRLELAFLMASYVVTIPWWFGVNYYHVSGYGNTLMRLIIWSSCAGILIWLASIISLGSVGIFLGFFLQMFIRSLALLIDGKRYWRLRPPWSAILIGTGFVFIGLLLPMPEKYM